MGKKFSGKKRELRGSRASGNGGSGGTSRGEKKNIFHIKRSLDGELAITPQGRKLKGISCKDQGGGVYQMSKKRETDFPWRMLKKVKKS